MAEPRFSDGALDRLYDFIDGEAFDQMFDGIEKHGREIDIAAAARATLEEALFDGDAQVDFPETKEEFDAAVTEAIRGQFAKSEAGALGMMHYGIATGRVRQAADQMWDIAHGADTPDQDHDDVREYDVLTF